MPVRKDLLNILANWFTIFGAICFTMYESILSNPVDLFDLLWRIILLISVGVVGVQNKCCKCVADSCKISVEVICYVCIVRAGYTIRCNTCIRDSSFFFSISPIVSHVFSHYLYMNVKCCFEVIFLCNSDYVG